MKKASLIFLFLMLTTVWIYIPVNAQTTSIFANYTAAGGEIHTFVVAGAIIGYLVKGFSGGR